MKTIWIVLLEDFEVDGRVQRQVKALNGFFNVNVISTTSNSQSIDFYEGANFYSLGCNQGVVKDTFKLIKTIFSLKFKRNDVVYFNNIYTIPSALFLRVFHRKMKFIYDSHELIVPDPKTKKSIASKKSVFLERLMVKTADLVVATNMQRAMLMKDYYALRTTPLSIENYIEAPNVNCNEVRALVHDKKDICFIYQGVLKDGRYLEEIVKSFEFVNAKLIIVGFGSLENKIKEIIEKNNLATKIEFLGKLNRTELYDVTKKCDVGIVTYDFSNMNNKYCSPNKTSEYVLNGLPIICTPQESLVSIVEKYDIGQCFDYSALESANLVSISSTFNQLVNKFNFYKSNVYNAKSYFDYKNEAKKLVSAVSDLYENDK